MLACLMHPSAFLSLAKLGVNLTLEEAKPKPCLWVFVICAIACEAGYVCFFLSMEYQVRMEDLLKGEMCQYISEGSRQLTCLTNLFGA